MTDKHQPYPGLSRAEAQRNRREVEMRALFAPTRGCECATCTGIRESDARLTVAGLPVEIDPSLTKEWRLV